MGNKKSLAEVMEKITSEMQIAMSSYLSKPIDLGAIQDAVFNVLRKDRERDQDHIKFIFVQKTPSDIEIVPCNLFTLLIMNGIYVKYELVQDADHWVTPWGVFKCTQWEAGGVTTYKNTITTKPHINVNFNYPISLER